MAEAVAGRRTSITDLPAPLIAQILQHVPQQPRLAQCALVCQFWASAAALATVQVPHKLKVKMVLVFQAWLLQHAAQLSSLHLCTEERGPTYKLQLPLDRFMHLQEMHLQGFELQLPGEQQQVTTKRGCKSSRADAGSSTCSASVSSSSAERRGQADTWPLLPSLRVLVLDLCKLAHFSSLQQITKAPQLTRLQIGHITFADAQNPALQQVAEVVPRLLQQLPRLAVLQLPGMPVTDAAMRQIGAMQGLQQLEVKHFYRLPVCDLQHLPSSLVQLKLHGSMDSHDFGPSLPPQLPQLTALLELDLDNCAVPPAMLGSVTQLQRLHMVDCRLLPCNWQDNLDTRGTAALLDVLPKLEHLRHLRLQLSRWDAANVSLQHFSALTASSHLTQLALRCEDHSPVRRGAVQYMFPPGRQMPHLQHVEISLLPSMQAQLDEAEGHGSCMDSDDIGRIISSCPNLQYLNISCSLHRDADASVLLQLPRSCTALVVGGRAFTDTAAPVIAQLTQLADLEWGRSSAFTDKGLEQLIFLQLTRLKVWQCGVSFHVSDPCGSDFASGHINLSWDPDKGSVAEQLNTRCDSSHVCLPGRLQRQRQAFAARERQLQEGQRSLQAENSSLRRQLAERDALIAQLQQQLNMHA